MGQVGGRFVHVTFVFVVEVPMYICSHSPWWVTECHFEMLPPLVRALGFNIFLIYDFSLLRVLAIFTFMDIEEAGSRCVMST